MFGPQKKTLIIVYKDEMLLNQLKKLIESPGKSENPDDLGISSETVNIVAWTEKLWKKNSAPGNITGKVLFLSDLKATDKLIPVIDKRICENGITFGWAGNQAVLYADPSAIKDHKSYTAFLEKLYELPIPEVIKYGKKGKPEDTPENEEIPQETVPGEDNLDTAEASDSVKDPEEVSGEEDPAAPEKPNIFKRAGATLVKGRKNLHQAGVKAVWKVEDLFRDKNMVKRQMLFCGVIKLYQDGLREFLEL